MTRSNKVTVYVNDAELSRLDREAGEANMSRSGYVLGAIQRQWLAEDADEAADRMNAEEKVEQIIADARDELVGIARSVEDRNEDVADMTARAGSYSIANFELSAIGCRRALELHRKGSRASELGRPGSDRPRTGIVHREIPGPPI